MKILPQFIAAALLATAPLVAPAGADDIPPGQVDFGTFQAPSNGGQFVEVNVKSSLLNLAARLAEKKEPEVADLLRNLKSIRVNVVGMEDGNRSELAERVKKLRAELDTKGWDRVVSVQEKQQEVGVYLKQRNSEAIEGVVVTVIEGDKEAVFVNVVGDIRPEKIALLGERLNIEPLKKVGDAVSGKHDAEGEKKKG